MKLERSLYDRSYLYFIAFFAMVILGFWFTYFTRILQQENYRMHLHGLALILWCLMLILQAFLVRVKKFKIHRSLGAFSYFLVPFMLWTTMELLLYQLRKVPVMGTMDYFFVALVVNALIVFVILYGLAIYHRKTPAVHGRYMLATIFPMFTPATDRIIFIFIEPMVKYLPTIEGNPIAPVAGFIFADVLLIGLIIWDWRSHQRLNVFTVALILLLMYHFSVMTFHQYRWWRAFSDWLVN